MATANNKKRKKKKESILYKKEEKGFSYHRRIISANKIHLGNE